MSGILCDPIQSFGWRLPVNTAGAPSRKQGSWTTGFHKGRLSAPTVTISHSLVPSSLTAAASRIAAPCLELSEASSIVRELAGMVIMSASNDCTAEHAEHAESAETKSIRLNGITMSIIGAAVTVLFARARLAYADS